MNNRGNIMLNLMFFLMGLAVLVIFISPISAFIGIAETSNNLNCPGYVYNGNPNATLSYNASLNSSSLTCLAMKLYLPYIVLACLIGGVSALLYNRVNEPEPTGLGM
jgi:hypothetical protein